MFLRDMLLGLIGFSAGAVAAAGVFAFLTVIGAYTRVIGKTGTEKHIMLFETILVIGGVCGNCLSVYHWAPQLGLVAGQLFLGSFGLATGVFVGCLVMSLAETLKAFPVASRRIHLAVGLQYLILSIGLGKMVGSFIYFLNRFGRG